MRLIKPAATVLLTTLVGFAAPLASAATSVALTGLDLQPRSVTLQGMDDREIGLFDASRKYATLPLDTVLVLTMLDTAGAPVKPDNPLNGAEPSVAELIDGQRLVGSLIDADDQGQSVVWSSPLLPNVNVSVSLEKLSGLTLHGEPKEIEAGAADRVVLMNGDSVTGFVNRVFARSLQVQVEGAKEPVSLPLERVRAVRFAAAGRRTGDGHRVTLRDGSVLLTPTLSVSDDRLTIKPGLLGGKDVTLDLVKVARIDVATPKGRLVDLATLAHETTSGGEVFGVAMPPTFRPGAVRMHAPVAVAFDLPRGAARFAARAELDGADVDPARLAAWADTQLIATEDGKEIGRWRLNGAAASAQINIPVTGRRLTLELDPAHNGPVLDRVILIEPVVLVSGDK
ncbi:MAG: hypothetical protein K8S99_05650 [Planctomycetes bacterium]|nr:hypothetical protein [Planctomycetota bacterium]